MIGNQRSENLMSQSSFWILNKEFTLEFGIDASLMLTYLSDCQEYFRTKNTLTEDGFFFRNKDIITKDTTISGYRQTQCLNVLVANKLLSKKLGVHGAIFYKVNNELVNETISGYAKKKNSQQE